MLFLFNRLMQMLLILWLLSIGLFGLLSVMPGNPVDLLITSNPNIKPEDVERLKKLRGLDQPWYIQYVRWMYGYHAPQSLEGAKQSGEWNPGFIFFFFGNTKALGFSNTYKRPVWELLMGDEIEEDAAKAHWWGALSHMGRIGNTLALMLPALLLSLLIALPLGLWSAYRQYSWWDYGCNFVAFVGISIPVFWLGIMVLYLFAERLQLFPAGGIQTPGVEYAGFSDWLLDRLRHSILPTLVLSTAYVGQWLRYMRASTLEILPSDFVRTARAKGLSEWRVVTKHVLRNAMIPVVTVLALSIPILFSGAVLTETVFSWPGIGRLQYDAVINNDYYVAIVVFLISAFLVMIGNLLADILYVFLDPRMRS